MSNEQKVFDGFFDEWRQHDEAMYRLYQAAPDLLAACQDVREWCDLIEQNYPEMRFTKAVRAAVAKATGTS